jgi:hypothetical protein
MLTSGAYVPGTILIATITVFLWRFAAYFHRRYTNAAMHMPLEIAAAAPKAVVDPVFYTAPPLRWENAAL